MAPDKAERASSDIRGFRITEVPSATAAKATALIVCDFEAGTTISPERTDAVDFIFTLI
jgi:hypothetical protein